VCVGSSSSLPVIGSSIECARAKRGPREKDQPRRSICSPVRLSEAIPGAPCFGPRRLTAENRKPGPITRSPPTKKPEIKPNRAGRRVWCPEKGMGKWADCGFVGSGRTSPQAVLPLNEIGVAGSLESQSHLDQTDRSLFHPHDFRRAPPYSSGIYKRDPDMLVRGHDLSEDHGSA